MSKRFALIATIGWLATSCATGPNLARDHVSVADFCEYGRAKKQFVFVLATYNGITKGTRIDRVKTIVESANRTNDFIRSHFVQAMLVNYFEAGASEISRNEPLYELFRREFVRGWAPVLPHVAWVKEDSFVACEDASCDGLAFPIAPSDTILFDWQNKGDNRCHDFFLEDGYIAGWGCRGNAYSLVSYMKQSGFNAGWLIANTYVAVPDNQKRKLCTDAGEAPNCYDIFESQENYVRFLEHSSYSRFPQTKAMTGYPSTWTQYQRKLIESAYSKDLALAAGTRITTKLSKEWTIFRITWDSSLICKYGRPNEDFYSH